LSMIFPRASARSTHASMGITIVCPTDLTNEPQRRSEMMVSS
jgi:hypothetical protein